ncbi:MAG: FAD-dependent oxidoreductase [Clostridia bacterium]|nr:FAD-dependent oxidoreductase [Clostridia bacterium]
MKIKIISTPERTGIYEIHNQMTLKEIYKMVNGTKRPRLIQVGGALGTLHVGYDIRLPLYKLKDELYEPSIAYFTELFCPVDYMRFMVRFLIRELNIMNVHIMQIHESIINLTTGKSSTYKIQELKNLLEEKSNSKGELFLKRNLKFLLTHFSVEVDEHLKGSCRDSICRTLFKAQCINACPAHIHIPGFVALMKENKIQEAYALMRQENPLSSICGAVCAKPCELKCRRGEITSTVGVRALQRFIALDALKLSMNEEKLQDNKYSIGIVGAGPAGLTAAYFLRRTGYQVTIYEKESRPGGTLAYGVPSYRLSNEVIRDEVESITNLGVEIHYNHLIDQKGYSILKGKHDALILATGTTIGKLIPLQHDALISGVDFLKSVRLSKNAYIGKKVVVIGGGDVAMDCARTARRLGGEVYLVSLESLDHLPASREEIQQAQEEKVYFLNGWSVDSVHAHRLHLIGCDSVIDDDGRFDPVMNENTLQLEDVDTIITCVGQKPALGYLPESFIETNGFVKANDYCVEPMVFAIGDMIRPTIAIDAIAQGKAVAKLVDAHLMNLGIYVGKDIEVPVKPLNIKMFDMDLKEEMIQRVDKRLKNFDEVTTPYTYEDALYEANRCMRCDQNSREPLLLGRSL